MRLISIDKLELLVNQEPVAKHHQQFKEMKVSYPDVWYKAWLQELVKYLRARQQRRTSCGE
jgi:erythromycin esterase-like protein